MIHLLQDYYSFFWALIAVLASFVAIAYQVYSDEHFNAVERKRMRLRDKAHFAHSQNRGAA